MQFIYKLFYKSTKVIAWLIVLILSAVLALYGRLAIGPIDLTPLQPFIQSNIDQQQLGFDLKLKHPVLKWQGWGSPIEIAAKDIAIHHINDQIIEITIPDIALTFRLRSLLQARFIPASLVFVQPKIIIKKFDVSEINNEDKPTSPQDFFKFILPLIDPDNDSRILKRVHFDRAQFIVQDDDDRALWSLSDTNFTLERHNNSLSVGLNLNYNQHRSIDFKANFTNDQKYWQGSLKFIDINPAKLFAEIQTIENSPAINDMITQLPIIDCNITGQINGKFINLNNVISADVVIESSPGQFKMNAESDKVTLIDHVLFKSQFNDRNFTINAFEIWTNDGLLRAGGQILFDPSFGHCDVDMKLSVQKFDIKNLSKYWPEQVVPEARSWVINNVQPASIPHTTLDFKGKYTFDKPALEVMDLRGIINLENATIHYMDDMPPITNINAIVNFDPCKINIVANNGQILNTLKIKQAVVDIDGLDKSDQHISINHVDIDGPIERVIDILNAKPLGLLNRYNITSDNIKGHVHSTFNMNFPLETSTTFDHLKFDIRSTVQNLTATNHFGGIPIVLNSSRSEIHVNDQYMAIESDVQFNDDPVHIYWKKFFIPHQKINSHLVLSGQLSSPGLAKINTGFADLLNGQIAFNVQYDTKDDHSGIVKVDTNLHDTELNLAGWKKLNHKTCNANAIIELKDDKPIKLSLLQLESGTDLNIKASGTFDHSGKFLEHLSIANCKIGATNVTAKFRQVKDNSYKVHIDGNKIDLKPHMDFMMQPSKNSSNSNIDLILNVKEIALDADKKLYNNDIKINLSNNKLNILAYVGSLQKHNQQHLYVNIFPHDNGRRLVLKCSNAGALLKSLQIFENFHGGQLKLAANHDDRKSHNSPWDGKLVIENFKLGQVPFLGRLFSLAVPTSFGDLFSDGNKMSFDILKVRFKLNSDKLIISAGRAHGPSLGITVSGTVQNGLNDLNMHGSILPAYFINTLISKIPLLGQLISGGKYEGIFGVSYAVVGTRNKPDINVNPLSVLTPGLFRQLFSPVDNKVDFDQESNILTSDK